MNVLEDILKSYRVTRSFLMKAKIDANEEDAPLISAMLSDVQFAIDWLNRGHEPDARRPIHRRSGRQRTITKDPLYMQSYAQPSACGSPTTLSDHERFQIDDALSSLSEREKQVYTFRYGLCFSIGQVALEMDISRSSVQTMLERAEKKVKENKENSLFLVG